jgi:Flp pilus assembly protein TadG
MQSISKAIRGYVAEKKGSVAVLFGATLIPVLGIVGVAIDYGGAVRARQALKASSEAAALAGTKVLQIANTTKATAETAASNFLAANLNLPFPVTKSVAADTSTKIVTVELTAHYPTAVARILGFDSIPLAVESRARAEGGGTGSASTNSDPATCVLALHPTSSNAVVVSGGGAWKAGDCKVWVNSSSSQAVVFSGGSSLVSAKNCFHGKASQGTFTPAPVDCGIKDDPFAWMNPPSPANCTYTNFKISGGTHTLNPGVYCGGITMSSGPTVTLNPGTYYIRNGKLTMSGGGSMTGEGVTFVIEGTSEVVLSGGGTYDLVAPDTGDFASFIFFQRPNANPGKKATLSGGGDIYYEGVIYFPTQKLVVSGTGSSTTPSPFTALIANLIEYSGTSTLDIWANQIKSIVTIPPELYETAPGTATANGGNPVLIE